MVSGFPWNTGFNFRSCFLMKVAKGREGEVSGTVGVCPETRPRGPVSCFDRQKGWQGEQAGKQNEGKCLEFIGS